MRVLGNRARGKAEGFKKRNGWASNPDHWMLTRKHRYFYPRDGGSSTTMNARTTKLPSHKVRGAYTMHH